MENKLAKKELTKYEIIHMLFKGLNENISKLENDVKNNIFKRYFQTSL